MKMITRLPGLVILIMFMMFLGGCGSGSGGGSGGSGSTGLLSLKVTDAPVDNASSVVVEFTGVEIQSSSGDRTDVIFQNPKRIDLLALHGGGSETILDNMTLPSGDYQWIRLKVNAECDVLDSYIEFNKDINNRHSIQIPSGSKTGLKLVKGFNLAADGIADFTIDFDLRKSVNLPSGKGNCSNNYKLKPALRIVSNDVAGSITGSVDESLINDPACTGGNFVYVFEGHGAAPDDIDGTAPDPVSSALVELDGSGDYLYRASFLEPGDYTVAFTCEANDDDPETDDVISFKGASNATVSPGQVAIHNF